MNMRSSISKSWWLVLGFLLIVGCGKGEDDAEALYQKGLQASSENRRKEALQFLTESIGLEETPWAYCERAKVYRKTDQVENAIADCKSGLAIEPEHRDLKWLLGELEKPKAQRFRGRNKNPPSTVK